MSGCGLPLDLQLQQQQREHRHVTIIAHPPHWRKPISRAIEDRPAAPMTAQWTIDVYQGCSALASRSIISDSSSAENAMSFCIVLSIPMSVFCICFASGELRRERWVGSRKKGGGIMVLSFI